MASMSAGASEGDDAAWAGPSMEELEEEARLEAMWTARGEEVRRCVLAAYIFNMPAPSFKTPLIVRPSASEATSQSSSASPRPALTTK